MTLLRRPLLVGVVVVSGPAVWIGHLLATYGLVYLTCRSGGRVWLGLVSLVAVAALGWIVAWGWRHRHHARAVRDGGMGQADSAAWPALALVGWLLAAYFLVVTAMAGIASIMVDPCL